MSTPLKVERNGYTLAAFIDGDVGRPWIVLSNSVASTHRMWDPQMALLLRKYRVLRYDSRGHGESDAPPGPYEMSDLALDIIAIMDAAGIETCDFMGLSIGGMMALDLAINHPQRFGKLVCCDSGPKALPSNAERWGRRIETLKATQSMEPLVDEIVDRWMTEPYRHAHPEAVEAAKGLIRSADPMGYAASGHALTHFDYEAGLAGITRPMLLVCGAQDLPLPAAMEAMAKVIPGSALAIVDPGAHLPNLENPHRFNNAVAGWLEIE